MPEPIRIEVVLYPVGTEPGELRDGRMCLMVDAGRDIVVAGYWVVDAWFSLWIETNAITHVGPMPEIEVEA